MKKSELKNIIKDCIKEVIFEEGVLSSVIMEVMKMISDFIKKEKLRLRFVIDIFIIFLIRDVIILSSHKEKDHDSILFLLLIIFIFFIFRILTIKYSPGVIKVSKDAVVEYDDEKENKNVCQFLKEKKKKDEKKPDSTS